MTIIDFPTRAAARRRRSPAHPTAAVAVPRLRAVPSGSPPTGVWLDAYEQLAACCAEVVARHRPADDPEWADLRSWIRGRLAVLDELKEAGVPPGAS